MRALVQRVLRARVFVTDELLGQIDQGLLVFLGVHREDTPRDAEWLAHKVLRLRVFAVRSEKMNHSVVDTNGGILVVPQFTLYGDTKSGNRPSYAAAAAPKLAKDLYEYFVELCKNSGIYIATGKFQAHMAIELVNDGPVTLWLDTKVS